MFDLNALRDFAAVARAGSFTAAAGMLSLPKTTLSTRIAALEAAAGLRLFDRTTRSLRLTDDGADLLAHATVILAEAEAAAEGLADRTAAVAGRLRLSAPVLLGETLVAPALAMLCAVHPGLLVEVELSDRRVDLVTEGFDLALRVGEMTDSTLVTRRIAVTRQRLVGPGAGALSHPDQIDPARALPFRGAPWTFHREGRQVTVVPAARLRLESLAMQAAAVRAGPWLALLPDLLVGPAIAAGLEEGLPDWTAAPISVHAVFPARRLMPPRLRAVINALGAAIDTGLTAI
jgi:LysR family transcriptional regulator, regulator for bpeEF and oprC